MNHFLPYSICIFTLLVFSACKKKTTIAVKLFNPALNEYVSNGTIVLIERHQNGWGNTSCKEIATAITNINGECSFDNERLRVNKNYDYYCAVKESWGITQDYPCSGKTSGFLKAGSDQDIIVSDEADGFIKVQYNNLLNPSQPGDSLIVSLSTIDYENPKGGIVSGGGGVFAAFPFYGCNGFPFPATVLLESIKTKGQKLQRYIRKHKMGVTSIKIDTIKVYPGTTTTVVVDW